ncbi:hypothetical protein RM844_16950 [Streptomyces sp. DSM 44915]|uniref:Uncharacterized protein n=1 Tax=Streptomyces chisholmiae TaxID=3075540 RepID=A0ABU2JSK4_9ACTN|nr:hypothetical protein [Streptomyces sp. DSM 44915]MDT0267970.1 hypothetical protein [Streptomyces sp. DSM 44915]
MSIKAPEGYISSFIGNGKVTHCIRKGVSKTLCGKDARNVSERPGTGIACKACATRVEAMTKAPAATTDTAQSPAQQPDTPATRQARITEKVNKLIEKVRASLKAGNEEAAQEAIDEADRLMAPLPPAMRGMLRGSLMEAKQTEPDPAAVQAEETEDASAENEEPEPITTPGVHRFETTKEAYDATQTHEEIKDGDVLIIEGQGVVGVLYKAWPFAVTTEAGELHHSNGKEYEWDNGRYVTSVELAEQTARDFGFPIFREERPTPTEEAADEETPEDDQADAESGEVATRDEEPETENGDQAPETRQRNEAEHDAKIMATLVKVGAGHVNDAIRGRVTGNQKIAQVLLDMRTRIKDKDGDLDLRCHTDEAKKRSVEMYALVGDAIKAKGGDHAADLLAEMKSIQRGVQTAMTTVVVEYIRSLDASPAEFVKFERAREEFPELSPSEAVWSYYEKVGKPLPRKTRAELAREKRALAKEARRQLTAKTEDAPEESTEENNTPDEDEETKSQHDQDMTTIKRAIKLMAQITERAAKGTSEERAEIKAQLEALVSAAGEHAATL